jgi:hypothetical protein
MNNSNIYSEDAVAFALYKQCIAGNSQVFFKFHHNSSFRVDRDWYYYCAPEVDLIEVRNDGIVVAYELKGSRRHKSGVPDFPNVFDAMGQAVAYLDLPGVHNKEGQSLFVGGGFDFVYVVCARQTPDLDERETRCLSIVPIGAMLALPDGRLLTLKEAPPNPLRNLQTKEHFFRNLNTLEKHTIESKIFRRIESAGQRWFADRRSLV